MSECRKILFVISKMGKGGAQQIVVDLVRGLSKRGFIVDIMVLYRSPQDKYFLDQIAECSRVIGLEKKPAILSADFRSFWPRLFTLVKVPFLVWRFVLCRKHEEYDAVHSNLLVASMVSWLMRFYAKILKRKSPFFIETFHADFTSVSKREKALFLFFWRHLDVLITELSRRDYKEISSTLPNVDVKYIPFGVGSLARADALSEGMFRKKCGLKPEQQTIVTISRINVSEKRIDKLVSVVAKTNEGNRGLRYLLCGDGPDVSSIKKQVTNLGIVDAVQFLGYVDDISGPLSTAKVFLIAGVEDLVGIAALQAASLGIPVVSFQTDSSWCGENDYFWNSDDIKAIALQVKRLLNDEKYHSEVSQSCQKIFNENFTVDSMINAYAELYRSIRAK